MVQHAGRSMWPMAMSPIWAMLLMLPSSLFLIAACRKKHAGTMAILGHAVQSHRYPPPCFSSQHGRTTSKNILGPTPK